MTSLVRPMPRSLDPLPGEALAGYLSNLAYRLDVTPAELAVRTGLETSRIVVSIDTGFAVRLPDATAVNFSRACNLSDREVTDLTLARWDGLLFDSNDPGKAARTLHGNGWLRPLDTRACPLCLADGHPHAPDRRVWHAAWKTPWAVACAQHGVLLADACNGCGHRFNQSGNRITSLVPNPTYAPTHPAACRTRLTGEERLCGQRIDRQAPTPAPDVLVGVQRRLDAVLNHEHEPLTSLGVPVSPAQYLRDLRLVAVLLQLADQRGLLTALPLAYRNALIGHLDHRASMRTAGTSHDRTWVEPPTNTKVLATLLTEAMHILDTPTAADARDLLPPLVAAALSRERLLWQRIRSTGEPSEGLFRYFAPNRAGVLSTHMIKAARTAPTPAINSDYVPAYLDSDRYQRWFAVYGPTAERNIRRAVPLAVTQALHNVGLAEAADLLDVPFGSAQPAVIRAGRACKHTDRADEFRTLVNEVAADLAARPVNYGHRRRVLGPSWQIPEQDWQYLQAAMLAAKAARRDTPWDERRTAITVYIWSIVTSGDPALAPMIATTSPSGRRSTGRALDAYSTLIRRNVPALHKIINNYARDLGHQIDTANQPSAPGVSPAPQQRTLIAAGQ